MSNLAEQLQDKSDFELHQTFLANSLGYWAENLPIILDGKPFSFIGHEYLRDIYYDTNPYKVIRKAAQRGYSTYCNLFAFHSLKYLYPNGILYLLPSRETVTDFSKTKLKKLTIENPALQEMIHETDSANVKRIGDRFLFFRGARTTEQLKAITVDCVIYDEEDEMDAERVKLAGHRMDHSDYRHWIKLSTPTIPKIKIDAAYLQSDQKQWFIPCVCGEETCLEDEFPNCIELQKGKWARVCKKCGRVISPEKGHWVKRNLESQISGYHISQLVGPIPPLSEIMEDFESGENVKEFHNSRLGLPYIDETHRLTREDVLSLVGNNVMRLKDNGPCSMGIDPGKDLHVVIMRRTSSTMREIVHIGTYRDWEKMTYLMKDFHVLSCVVDGQPDTQSARNFANKSRGMVFLRMGYAIQTMGHLKWDYDEFNVKGHRTETLDNSHNAILGRLIILPRRSQEIEEFADHCTNIAKTVVSDPETGESKAVWIKTGPDHYRHAFNFAWMADQRLAYFPDVKHEYQFEGDDFKPLDALAGY